MHIIHVIGSVEDEAAGPSYSVPRLCAALAGIGDDVRIMAVGALKDEHRSGVRYTIYPNDWPSVPILNRLYSSRLLANELVQAAKTADVMHNHGLWLMPNVYSATAARRAGCAFVVSPRGMLHPDALAISRFRKLSFWHAFQKKALQSADCIHVTSAAECAAVRAFGLRQPVVTILNGIDIPDTLAKCPNPGRPRTVLYFGRLHPIKNIESLIDAWAILERRFPDWELRIVGSGADKYIKSLKGRAESVGVYRIIFNGPVYGADKVTLYQQADIYVLPSKSENFGVTVAEAMAGGTPVITTIGTPWSKVQTENCGWWIEHGAEALSAALEQAMEMPRERLIEMGTHGRNWMVREFSWDLVANQMQAVYRWLAGRGPKPATVQTE